MKLPRLRTILLAPVLLFAAFYVVAAVVNVFSREPVPVIKSPPAGNLTIAIFGASGTAGDGILKAALASPDIQSIQVITRRTTPRIEEGVASGKVQMTLHQDYLDYSSIREQLKSLDAVYWAIGMSSIGVDEETYGRVHVDFPTAFVSEWLIASEDSDRSIHYISSSDISADSSAMWAREKVRAEESLYGMADGTTLKVIAYRPDYIGPTREEAQIGQRLLYGFFKPVGAAVKATQIGQAMIEVTARGAEFNHGDKLSTRKIIRYGNAYERRQGLQSRR